MKNKKNIKGFTIIELVVVIAIISVLSLIIVPNVTKYRTTAEESKIKSEMLNVFLGAEAIAGGYTTKATTEAAIKANSFKDLKSYTGLKQFTHYTFTANADGTLASVRYADGTYTFTFNGDVDAFMD